MSSRLHQNAKHLDLGLVGDGSIQLTELSDEDLFAKLWAMLRQRIHGMCFSAYEPGQNAKEHPILPVEQVRRRMEIVAPHTRWVRTFAATEGNEHGATQAKAMGVQTLAGAWLEGDDDRNEAELEAIIELAKAGHTDMVAIGNEVLLRGEMSVEQLISYLRRFKEAVPNVPVGYVDAYFLFPQHPALVEACDFLPINCYPFWEGCAARGFGRPTCPGNGQPRRRRVAGDKPVLIAETGWPTAGTARGWRPVPGPREAALYALNMIPWAAKAGRAALLVLGLRRGMEGGCSRATPARCWGFWDADG